MYILATISDVVQIPPSEFHKPSAQAIEDFINAKYSDKVIHKVGLCVGFWDLISTSDGLIGHGTGVVNVNVDFRMVVFRPFQGEILQAVIRHSDIRGIQLSMDFFEDILVPPQVLFEGSELDNKEGAYVWHADVETDLFFDRAEPVRFRVEQEEWTDISPQQQHPPPTGAEEETEEANGDGQTPDDRKPPYEIYGSMMHSGLGPMLWWLGVE